MTAEEGVTKFDLSFTPSLPLPRRRVQALIVWRDILRRLGLVGQDPARYGGVGFGNLSRRLSTKSAVTGLRFTITGTQTGALPALDAHHFAIVIACDWRDNHVRAEGPIAPSSESLTHAMLYHLDPSIGFVFHVHSSEIWQARTALNLPTTAPEVAYGTPAMAEEMQRLWHTGALARRHIVAMAGHEDGVIGFGRSADQAGMALLRALVRALSR